MKSHLSIQQASNWLMENMGDKSSYEFIHQHKDKRKKVIEDASDRS
jgi:hypothetical protein